MTPDSNEQIESLSDNLPGYTGQDLGDFTVLMVHAVASRLGVVKRGQTLEENTHREDEMRTGIKRLKPEALIALDETIVAYRDWSEAKAAGAADATLNILRQRTQDARKKLSALI